MALAPARLAGLGGALTPAGLPAPALAWLRSTGPLRLSLLSPKQRPVLSLSWFALDGLVVATRTGGRPGRRGAHGSPASRDTLALSLSRLLCVSIHDPERVLGEMDAAASLVDAVLP